MTWTKIDSSTPDDPRLLQLPRGVRWMHVEALVWSNQHGTDGSIPEYALRRVTDQEDPVDAAAQLVSVGLWEVAEGGWIVVDFAKDQPSAADEERRQVLARQRQRKQRQHKGGDHTLCDPRYCQQASRVTAGVTNGVSHDTRTDRPDRPDRSEGTEGREGNEGRGGSPPGASAAAPHGTGPSGPPHGDLDLLDWAAGPPPGTKVYVNGVEIAEVPS